MTIAKRILAGLAILVAALGIAIGIGWIATAPEALPPGSESAARLAPGPSPVGREEIRWIDATRPTPANGDYPGSSERRLPATLWFPRGEEGKHPLVVFIHGLMSSREGCTYLAESLASHGYVVVCADYPLSHANAHGGATYLDVVNQPADVSFLIDRALALESSERPFTGELDPDRIGVFGISLGGATATLVGFHPEWRDPRVSVVISISGPGDIFGPRFFDEAAVAFLMIAGTSDAIVDYEINAAPIPERVPEGGLLTIEGGTHAGSTYVTSGLLRLAGNPDELGCGAAAPDQIPRDKSVFVGLFGTPEQGLLVPTRYRPPCDAAYDNAMRAGRQQMIVALAVRAFFGTRFGLTEEERNGHESFLEHILPEEIPEVRYTPARRARSE